MRFLYLWVVTVVLFTAFPVSLLAQSDTTQLSGLVQDQSGSSIPNASVQVKNEATGLNRRATTNEGGYYVVAGLPPGLYTVIIEVAGFKRYSSTRNKLDPNIPARLNASLELGAQNQTVEVVASVVQLQLETATLGKLVESSQIEGMMLNGRNPLYLALMKPGVAGNSMATFNFGITTDTMVVNGARVYDTAYIFDGAVGTRSRASEITIGLPDLDAVQEMQVLTSNYSAEYGRASGGQFRIVTKSGSRDFHGSAYDYLRNEALDANDWTRNRAGLGRIGNKFNQFGYSFSGPVHLGRHWNKDRNKLFFLWSQEWVRFRQDQTTIVTVPSLAMRAGDYSELLNPSNIFFGRARVVNDPVTGAPFPGNIIPANRLSQNGLALLSVFPAPTPGYVQGSSNFIETAPQPQNQRKDTISIDLMPSQKHVFRFRTHNYSWKDSDAFKSGTDIAPTVWNRPNKVGSLNYIWTISPSMVNEVLVSASWDKVDEAIHGKYERSRYGITYPYLFPDQKHLYDKVPTIDISNFTSISAQYPNVPASAGTIYNFSDNISKNVGHHLLKFGVMLERTGENDAEQLNVTGVPGGTNNQNGRFTFDDVRSGGASTGLAIANAAMGLFTTYAEVGPQQMTPYRGNMFEWFAQDSWKVAPKLTIELGLRHSLQTPYFYSLWGNMSVFDQARYNPSKAAVVDPATGNVISGDRYNGVVIPGTGWPDAAKGRIAAADSHQYDYLFSGGDKTWGQFHKKDFAPRLGIVYAINSKTVIRAGGGLFYNRQYVWDNISLGGNPPLQPMASLSNGLVDNPGGGGNPSAFPFFYQTFDPVLKNPAAWQWNFTAERDLGFHTTLEVAYVGHVGLHLERVLELNQLAPGTLQNPANKNINVNALRYYKGYAFINEGQYSGRSSYNGLQIGLTRRFSKGLSYGFAYTYSKSLDNGSGRRDQPYNSLDDRSFWGPSSFDRRHVAVINFLYEAPFLRGASGLRGTMLGGWQISGITQFQTGAPFSIGTGVDYAGIGSGTQTQLWQMNGDTTLAASDRRLSTGASDQNFWFRTKNPDGSPIFTAPAAGTFSATQTKNELTDVGFQNWNLALFKDFRVREKQKFEFRVELFNWINHPRMSAVDKTPTSSTFGKVTSLTGSRNVQLSLRYNF
jgi:hypothetical protein